MKIIIGVTGSISAYKAYDLCRELTKENHEVKVILTHGATNFIKADTFKYLGATEVYSANDDFNLEKYKNITVLHVELAKWADRLVIAPASANIISELSHGFAKDLLSTLFLAFTKQVQIYPAMNTNMLNNEIIQENISRLKKLKNIYIHGTKSGLLACGDEGAGKLEDIEKIKLISTQYPNSFNSKKVLITTGATIAPLDPVRYVTNPSSGLTGFEMALHYLFKGWEVELVCGYNTHHRLELLENFPGINFYTTNTTKEMLALVKEKLDTCDTYISSAAISDIEFQMSEDKLKKDHINILPQTSAAPDILKYVIDHKKNQKIVGFAAETTSLPEMLLAKYQKKPVDLLIGNLVSNGVTRELQGFKQSKNQYTFYKNNQVILEKEMSKSQLAQSIYQSIEE